MSRQNSILGGYLGDNSNTANDDYIVKNADPVPSGIYPISEHTILRYAESWPRYSDGIGAGVYVTSSQTVDMTTVVPGLNPTHAFVIIAGGGGSGAADDDCQGQGPGGRGGFGKALVNLSGKGTSASFSIGSGGSGVRGNDANGNSGQGSRCTIGSFSINANGGEGGKSKNENSRAGNPGGSNSSGADSFSSSQVFYSPLVANVEDGVYNYVNVQTSVNGSGGGCGGGGSGSGQNGFGYIRFGNGINASTTLTPGNDGVSVPYTPFY